MTSSSDSETDQSDNPTNQETEKRLKTKWSCIRQAALLTLKIILKNATKRDLCHYWKLFLPSGISKGGSSNLNESDLDQSNCGLLISILFDPAARARNLAVDVLRHFLQQCKQFISKVCESANPKYSKKAEKARVRKYYSAPVVVKSNASQNDIKLAIHQSGMTWVPSAILYIFGTRWTLIVINFNSKKVQFNSSFRLLGESVSLSMERLHYLLVFAIEREYKKNFASNYNLVSFKGSSRSL